ncbi:ABC transporter, permease protein 2 (cluster 5, nickel/peptides/opines) [hydrothermal vent metagenome]|uniref:ABC transporter, permease protein 2 (Cluster 5, nickel/peptides/opines) n=1 Tax=hydrothermal vent metagenome TaxID=652676 RepID=A0A3B0VDU3_9ZZZZ
MPVILATDIIIYLVFLVIIAGIVLARGGDGYLNQIWQHLKKNRLAMVCMVILILYGLVALGDSIRWRDRIEPNGDAAAHANGPVYSANARSILDRALAGLREKDEKTFSAPLATKLFVKETLEKTTPDGTVIAVRDYPPLKYPGTHLLGTDKVGGDVLLAALKGVRTGVVIGTGTTIIIIPFAILFGVLAGYFGGRVDDLIQYVYTTLSSIPGVLLIVAFMLIFGAEGYQGGVIKETDLWFGLFVPSDRLFWLCVIMGITSWTDLCRLIRGETMKLRELEYVQAAKAFGVSNIMTMLRHIIPNLMHLVLITFILQFSGLVLAEAVLSYIGIGVGPQMGSWGNMINTARLELSREPVVWWSLVGAFIFIFGLVLPANIFGDAIRDALDPKLRLGRK